MKKIILFSFILVVILGLTGCGNSSNNSMTSVSTEQKTSTQEFRAEDYREKISGYNRQDLMQESLRIQTDKIMSKEEKAVAFEEIQKRNKELLDEELAN